MTTRYDILHTTTYRYHEPVNFGPGTAAGCKDGVIARIRAGRRPAPGMPPSPATRPVLPRS